MTIAICTECGKEKFGAFSPCDRCGFTPVSSTEQAKSILLSDHHHNREKLRSLTEDIQAGRPIAYDPAALAMNVQVFETMDADPDAFQCTICGEDVDWFGETVCARCKEDKHPPIGNSEAKH